MYYVVVGKDFFVVGLEWEGLFFYGGDVVGVVGYYVFGVELVGWIGLEVECYDYCVGGQYFFVVGDWFWVMMVVVIRFVQFGFYYFDVDYFIVFIDYFDWLVVEQELYVFFFGVGYFMVGVGYVFFVLVVGVNYVVGVLVD